MTYYLLSHDCVLSAFRQRISDLYDYYISLMANELSLKLIQRCLFGQIKLFISQKWEMKEWKMDNQNGMAFD